MTTEYSIGVNNRFALFCDNDDDPGDIIPAPTLKKDETSKSAKNKGVSKQQGTKGGNIKEGKEKVLQQSNRKTTENGTKSDKPQSSSKAPPRSGGRTERGDNRQGRGDNDDRPVRAPRGVRPRLSSRENQDNEGGIAGDQGFSDAPRSPKGRGSRPFRGRVGGTGFRGGKREFERRSGNDKSSVKPVDKREGGGARNWGRQEDLQNDEWPSDEVEPTRGESEPITNGETLEEVKTDDKGEDEVPAEDEGPQEMTLEEYKAKMNSVTVKPELQERKAGENVDTTQWKNTFQLEKADEDFFSGTREVIEKPKTSGRTKTTIDTTGFFFKDQARRGRGRTPGGPGAGRGNRRSGEGNNFNSESQDERRPWRGDDRRPPRNDDGGRDGDRRPPRNDDGGRGDRRPQRSDDGGRGDRRPQRSDDGGRGERRPPRNDDGGRGDRRPPRNDDGGRRQFGRKREYAPNVEDENDFPQLGGK